MKPKTRKCGICRKTATQYNAVNAWCSPKHGAQIAIKLKVRKEKRAEAEKKREHAQRRKQAEPLKALLNRVKRACHAYIHARDAGKPCISCGKFCDRMEAGHYKAAGRGGASPARFDPDNIHLQCHPCNRYNGGGNHYGYRPNLVGRIGEDRVLAVERLHNSRAKWDRGELAEIADRFRAMTDAIKADRSSP